MPALLTPTRRPLRTETIRHRAQLPAFTLRAWPEPALRRPSPAAKHDFLVPNPRPDLTTDAATLRMIERP